MTATIHHKNALGHGIYTAPDIAHLLGLPRSKVNRYLKTYWDERLGKNIFNETYTWQATNSNTKAVNFYVLIELYTFFQLQEMGVKTKHILAAREHIAQATGYVYPFATSDVLTDGAKIYYQFKEAIVNADGTHQTNFVEIIKDFVSKIEFDQAGNAQKFYPNGRNSVVVVNPHNQFGQPIIDGTNINAEMIFSMYQSGESEELIAHLYALELKAIKDAVQFYQKAA